MKRKAAWVLFVLLLVLCPLAITILGHVYRTNIPIAFLAPAYPEYPLNEFYARQTWAVTFVDQLCIAHLVGAIAGGLIRAWLAQTRWQHVCSWIAVVASISLTYFIAIEARWSITAMYL